MAAKCAACGLRLTGRDRFKLVEHYVVHASCVSIQREIWSCETDKRDLERRLRYLDEDMAARTVKLHRLEAEVGRIEAQVKITQRHEKAWRVNDVLRVQVAGLETELAIVREDLAASEERAREAAAQRTGWVPSPANPEELRGRFNRALVEIGKRSLGLAVGRGIWGMAAWFTRIALDTDDASLARYGLLELT